MTSILPYPTIIFDCDGVIFDSNSLKTDAFRDVVKEYPDDLTELFIDYHKANGGVSRYEKFLYFQEKILVVRPDENVTNRMLSEFGDACRRLYLEASFTPECPEFLEKWSRSHKLFVASGSDEAELRDVFEQRGISDYFSTIYGSPKKKAQCIQEVLRSTANDMPALMIGDAVADWEAARSTGIDFVFMSSFSECKKEMQKLSRTNGFTIIKNLSESESIIRCQSSLFMGKE